MGALLPPSKNKYGAFIFFFYSSERDFLVCPFFELSYGLLFFVIYILFGQLLFVFILVVLAEIFLV